MNFHVSPTRLFISDKSILTIHQVEGPLNSGVVHVHMIKHLDKNELEYQLLALDVKGHSRIILEKASEKPSVASSLKLFGIQWR
jgi:TIM21.